MSNLNSYISYREEKNIHYVTTNTLMLDWDLPDDAHYDKRCITITHRCQAYSIMYDWCKANSDYLFKVYETPGGVRAFVMSHDFTWDTTRGLVIANHFMRFKMRCDELYIGCCIKRRNGFPARVSPKAGRVNDFVARHVRNIGKGIALPHHKANVAEHDRLINEYIGLKPPTHIMLCGLPGAGKSTYAKNFPDHYYISPDKTRKELYGSEMIYGDVDEVWSAVFKEIEFAKSLGKQILYDGCCATKKLRRVITKAISGHWEVYWIDKSPELCCQQQKERLRQVPESVIHEMAETFEAPSTEEFCVVAIHKV